MSKRWFGRQCAFGGLQWSHWHHPVLYYLTTTYDLRHDDDIFCRAVKRIKSAGIGKACNRKLT
jgi:hypothetical protein